MIQIDDVVVSLDVLREKFLCNLDACKGECCIEGDAGAPVELEEVEKLEEVLPVIWDELAPEARAIIEKQGVVYTDEEGDLVTSIVNNKDCVFTCYDEKGCCYCAIEKAYREGKTDFYPAIFILSVSEITDLTRLSIIIVGMYARRQCCWVKRKTSRFIGS